MKKLLQPLAFLIAMSAFSGSALADQQVEIKVSGMVCNFCAIAIDEAFSEIDGVTAVDVDLDSGRVSLTAEDGFKLDEQEARDILSQVGYEFLSLETK